MRVNFLLPPNVHYSKTKHTLIAGISGYGKGMFGEFYVSQFVGYEKVFDLHSESRGEGMYYGLPQTDSGLLRKMSYLTRDTLKRKTFKNEIIMFRGKNLAKMPSLPANIKITVFNEEWLTNEDLKRFLSFNEQQSGFLETVFEIHNDQHVTLSYLYEFLQDASANKKGQSATELRRYGVHYATINTIKRRVRLLLRSGIFFNKNEEDVQEMNNYFCYLDVNSSIQDIESITTYSTYLIEDIYIKYVAEAVLLKKFLELIETRQFSIPVVVYIRELNDFYYMKHNAPSYVLDIQDSIEKILRKGRFLGGTKVTVIGDTQLLDDISDALFNSFNKFICFRLPVKDSEKLLRKATIPREYLYKLASCDVGKGMYVVNGTFQYLALFIPTLHKKADPDFDVFEYLCSIYGAKNYEDSSYVTILKSHLNKQFIALSLVNQDGGEENERSVGKKSRRPRKVSKSSNIRG